MRLPTPKNSVASYVSTAYLLGIVLGLGLASFVYGSSLYLLGLYCVSLSVFHFFEFVFVANFHPTDIRWQSFLLDHSPEYITAICASVLEYFVEWLLLPGLKRACYSFVGIFITLAGQIIRIVALFTAEHNFTHEIAEEKKEKHKLVTHGIYRYLRHPGYMGWFWWSVGSQILLVNPICIAGFFYASYRFFAARIPYEEQSLCQFFPGEYEEYRKRTPTMIPFVP